MDIILKRDQITDEFGNSYFRIVKYYKLDPYIFNYIKEFIFDKRKKKYLKGILSLISLKNNKYNIINQKINGLLIKKENNYTDKQTVLLTPSVFGLKIPISDLFISIKPYNDVFVCDIYDNEFVRNTKIIINVADGLLYEEYDYVYVKKSNKILGTLYVNKNKYNSQINITDNDVIGQKYNKLPIHSYSHNGLLRKYGNDIVNWEWVDSPNGVLYHIL